MKTNPNQATLAKYVSDMLAIEQHFVEMLNIQETDAHLKNFPEAEQQIQQLRCMTENHMSDLDIHLKELNGSGRAVLKEMVGSVTGMTMGAASKLRTHSTSKILRDAYATLSLHAIGYTMLHATGLALGSPETARIALTHLESVTHMIIEISRSVIPVVTAELSETLLVDASSVEIALQNTQRAWRWSEPALV